MKATTNKTAKQTSIEGKFFGMIVLAWAVLAVVFNVAHSALPQAKQPAGKSVAATVTQTGQVVSIH
jgi:hypothetical protein